MPNVYVNHSDKTSGWFGLGILLDGVTFRDPINCENKKNREKFCVVANNAYICNRQSISFTNTKP